MPRMNRQQAPQAGDAAYDADDPRRWIALGVLLLAAAMDLIDTTVATVALPVIGDELGASDAALEWIIAGYGLAFALGLITGGRLGDVLGRRRVFLIGLAGFTATSALCGLAPGPELLVTARVGPRGVRGVDDPAGPGDHLGQPPRRGPREGIRALRGRRRNRDRRRSVAERRALEADVFSWRPIFLVNVPLGLIAIAVARAFVRESRAEDPPRLDLAGAALLTVALVLLLFPLVEGHQLGWPAWTLAAMAASAPALGLFVVHQRRREVRGASALVPPSLFRRRAFAGGTLATLAFFSIPSALLFVITVTLQAVGLSPLHTALTFVPLSLASVPTAAASVVLARRLGRTVTVGGTLVVALGIAALLLALPAADAQLTTWALVPGLVITGLGLGLVAPTLIDVVLAGVDPRDVGAASGVRSTASQLGGAIGVALIGLIFYGARPTSPGGGYTHALGSALWYALAVAIVSALAMLLLPKRRNGATVTQPGMNERDPRKPTPAPSV